VPIAALKKKFPGLLYIIAGEGPYKKEIYEQAKELGIIKQILFMGWISEPEKSVLLKNSQLFVMTPTIEGESVEGFGMSFIDAGFHRLATIGTDSGGINDAIINEKTGLICNENDQKDITKKIEYLLSNDSLRKQYGDNGYAHALNQFTWSKKIKEYLSII
jgi:phosphatidylinositol alpha-1,6-mannosyltransferase